MCANVRSPTSKKNSDYTVDIVCKRATISPTMSKPHNITMPSLDGTVGVDGAAKRYGVHPGTIRRWVKSGRLGAIRVGGKLLRFSDEHFANFEEASIVQL